MLRLTDCELTHLSCHWVVLVVYTIKTRLCSTDVKCWGLQLAEGSACGVSYYKDAELQYVLQRKEMQSVTKKATMECGKWRHNFHKA